MVRVWQKLFIEILPQNLFKLNKLKNIKARDPIN